MFRKWIKKLKKRLKIMSKSCFPQKDTVMSNYRYSCFSRGCSDSSPCEAAKERLEHKLETYGEYVQEDGQGSLVR